MAIQILQKQQLKQVLR